MFVSIADEIFLQPDCILPCQYRDELLGDHHTPEQRLLLAVLSDALWLILNSSRFKTRTKMRSALEAVAWVNDDSDGLCSFSFVCAALSIDADKLKRDLMLRPAGPFVHPYRKR
jgi:hypothetical protein